MGTCATCKHWEPFDGHPPIPHVTKNALGVCGRIPNFEDARLGGELAVADDASGLGHLRTAADFGCVLHETNPERNEEKR